MFRRSASDMSSESTIIRVRISTSRPDRPSRSISGTCVSLKKRFPASSSYSLSNVPPVTKMRMMSMNRSLRKARIVHAEGRVKERRGRESIFWGSINVYTVVAQLLLMK